MGFVDFDWASFIGGAVTGAAVLFFTGVLQKAGEDVYAWAKRKLLPGIPSEPIPHFVDKHFKPVRYAAEDCAWVPSKKVGQRRAAGWTHYNILADGLAGHCARRPNTGSPEIEYLMVRPGAKETPT